MTSAEATSGTDRVAEVARSLPADVYVNLQGDEPLMPGENVDRAVETLLAGDRPRDRDARGSGASGEAAADPNAVKVAVARGRPRALLLALADPVSSATARPRTASTWASTPTARTTLAEIAALPPSPLERAESLEQLRWLEAGYTIWVGEAAGDSIGVDTPADLRSRREDGGWKKEAMA